MVCYQQGYSVQFHKGSVSGVIMNQSMTKVRVEQPWLNRLRLLKCYSSCKSRYKISALVFVEFEPRYIAYKIPVVHTTIAEWWRKTPLDGAQ